MNISVGLKIWDGHGLTEKYGNAIITNISSEMNDLINVFHNILSTTPKNGGMIIFLENKIYLNTSIRNI